MTIESLFQDIRYALRSFRKSPFFAAGVIGTIGLGLGFVCSAFTVINGYLLKPFDVRDPHALYELTWDSTAARRHAFNIDELEAIQASNEVFSDVLGFAAFQLSLDDGTAYALAATGNYFDALGVQPFLGRLLRPDDAARPGERAVVVLSHDAWLARFGADPSIVGRHVRLGRHEHTVVGIAQPGFLGLGDTPISFWVPLTMAREFPLVDPYGTARPSMLKVFAHVRPGVSDAEGRAWFDVWLKQRFSGARAEDVPILARVEPRGTRIPITPQTTTLFSAMVAAFGLVLLIACANAANMMLARGLGRQREIAVRLSLGARRSRVVRQLLMESVLLAVPAALVGLGLTFATARVVPALLLQTWPAGLPPIQTLVAPMDPDIRVVAFLILAAAAATVLFGLSPALQTTRTSLTRASRGEFGEGVRVSQVRNALVMAQIGACALFLVAGSGLLNELQRLADVDTGLDIDAVADLRVDVEHRAALVEQLAMDPRVESVAAVWRAPLYGPLPTLNVTPAGSTQEAMAGYMVVSPEYFETMRIPVLRGRGFTRAEGDALMDVALVSEATAARFWPDQDAVGQTLEIGPAARGAVGVRRPSPSRVRIIGVTRDVTSGTLMDGRDSTCVYFPTSVAVKDHAALLVRSRGDVLSLHAAVAAAAAAVSEGAAFPVYPMRQVMGVQIWSLQVVSATVSLLAAVALLLAFSGTYGVVAFLVAQRTREFGIRMALGATAPRIVRRVIGEAVRLGAGGMAIGGLLALGISRVLASVIERIMPSFGLTAYVIGAAVILTATVVAASVPSLRAARLDPASSLRSE